MTIELNGRSIALLAFFAFWCAAPSEQGEDDRKSYRFSAHNMFGMAALSKDCVASAASRDRIIQRVRALAYDVRYNSDQLLSQGRGDVIEVVNRVVERCRLSERESSIPIADLRRAVGLVWDLRETRIRNDIQRRSSYEDVSTSLGSLEKSSRLGLVTNTEDTAKFISAQREISRQTVDRTRQMCTPINLGPEFGPSRDQDSTGWCFGFVAADLLSHRLKMQISAADLTITHFNWSEGYLPDILTGRGPTTKSGGHIEDAVDAGVAYGLCLESDFSSRDNGLAEQLPLYELMTKITDINSSWSKTLAGACKDDLATARRLFPDLKLDDISDALWSSQAYFVGNLAERACQPRLKPTNVKASTVWGTPDQVFENLNKALDQKKPVGISISNAGYLMNGEIDGSGNHGVSVIGRRFDPKRGRCDYLVRNSWGSSCQAMPTFECEDESKGHVWVPQSGLAEGLYGATTLD